LCRSNSLHELDFLNVKPERMTKHEKSLVKEKSAVKHVAKWREFVSRRSAWPCERTSQAQHNGCDEEWCQADDEFLERESSCFYQTFKKEEIAIRYMQAFPFESPTQAKLLACSSPQNKMPACAGI
jgi:hypothetical protein